MNEANFDRSQVEKLLELDEIAKGRARKPVELNAITRSDREYALETWLQGRGIGIGIGTGRIVELVTALKTYTYMDKAPVQSVDVREGLDNTLIILHNKLKRGVNVVREYAGDVPVIQAFASELNQVWTNIIDNASDAMNGEGKLIVRARRQDPWVLVEIEDNGPGIPEENQSRIFDAFFTTKGSGTGTGLGLNISRNLIVQKHQGQISVESDPGRTCFSIRLPMDFNPGE
jgi:signal transduction histidine kinase